MRYRNYFIEYKRYSIREIAEKLDSTILEAEKLVKKLENRFVKSEMIKKSESGYIADVIYYYFDFVGVIVEEDIVIHCIPSFFLKDKHINFKDEYSKVTQVIDKYYSKIKSEASTSIYESYSRVDKSRKNLIELIIELLRDYLDNGLYENVREVILDNSDGEIDWDITINEISPILVRGRPLYHIVKTLSRETNDSDIIKRLHLSLIYKGYLLLNKCGLDELLGISNICVFGEEFDDIGSIEYFKKMILKERNVQYSTRKLYVLDLMHSILNEYEKSNYALETYNFGTKNFNYVWEEICSQVITNHKDVKLNRLEVVKNNISKEYIDKSLSEIIEPVKWVWSDKEEDDNYKIFEQGKPNPDILLFRSSNDEVQLYILDAKYYNFHIDQEDIINNPGLSDVIKQYVYELSLKKFTETNNITINCNAFLFPTFGSFNNEESYVIFNPFTKIGDVKFNNIKAYRVDASALFDAYINGTHIDIDKIIDL